MDMEGLGDRGTKQHMHSQPTHAGIRQRQATADLGPHVGHPAHRALHSTTKSGCLLLDVTGMYHPVSRLQFPQL